MEADSESAQVEQKEQITSHPATPVLSAKVQHTTRSATKWFSGVGSALGVGLFLAGSAALGGIAMVLWNRRLLTEMRSASAAEPEQYTLFDE